jgi:hypothetical protein
MTLQPSIQTVQSVKDNISSVLQNHALAPSMRAALIGSQLALVNEWSDQTNLVLEHSEAPAPVNLVFAIRKDLFVAPQYVQCILGVSAAELPPAFPAFLAMILKLIGAQKTDKEKPVVKVVPFLRLQADSHLIFLVLLPSSLSAFLALSLNRMSILMKKKMWLVPL